MDEEEFKDDGEILNNTQFAPTQARDLELSYESDGDESEGGSGAGGLGQADFDPRESSRGPRVNFYAYTQQASMLGQPDVDSPMEPPPPPPPSAFAFTPMTQPTTGNNAATTPSLFSSSAPTPPSARKPPAPPPTLRPSQSYSLVNAPPTRSSCKDVPLAPLNSRRDGLLLRSLPSSFLAAPPFPSEPALSDLLQHDDGYLEGECFLVPVRRPPTRAEAIASDYAVPEGESRAAAKRAAGHGHAMGGEVRILSLCRSRAALPLSLAPPQS